MIHNNQEDEFLQHIRGKMSDDNFAAMVGVEIIKASPGYAMTKLVIGEQHFNAAGVVQGGAIFTLADFAFAVAANSSPQVALAIECQLSFLRPTSKGTLWAETEQIGDSKSFSSFSVKVTNDKSELVAQFYGRAYKVPLKTWVSPE